MLVDSEFAEGYLLIADPNWINFHRRKSKGGTAYYIRGTGAPMRNVADGALIACVQKAELPRRIHLYGRFRGAQEIRIADAWNKLGTALGASSHADWFKLIEDIPSLSADGSLLALCIEDVGVPTHPLPLASVDIELKNTAVKGRGLKPDEVSRLKHTLQVDGISSPTIASDNPISTNRKRFWWVNQNQTYDAEKIGGYLWSPKRNRNGAKNQFYENMREVSPGDLIFSFCDARIKAVGTAISNCYDAPKPVEFGTAGDKWANTGWKVDVDFTELPSAVHPKTHIELLRPLLPDRYSPLQRNGDGLQSVYLAEVSIDFADALKKLLVTAGNPMPEHQTLSNTVVLHQKRDSLILQVEDGIESRIRGGQVNPTEKEQLIKARRGQGQFRESLQTIEQRCRVTQVVDPRFLIAGHIKPWREANDLERLDGENGLFLSPAVDFLFDRGFISFADDGELLISPVSDLECLERLGIPSRKPFNGGSFTERQKQYLSFHRQNIFLKAGQK